MGWEDDMDIRKHLVFLWITSCSFLWSAVFCGEINGDQKVEQRPNVIIFFIDDMGYADIGVFGAKRSRTPNIDQLAKEGVKFTDFYSGWTACSPSRASLLTGCYAMRVGMHGGVCFPDKPKALNPKEHTMAEMFKGAGYTTGLFGKWHLGHLPGYLPPDHGFDSYWGIPYSNDMWNKYKKRYPPLPFLHNNKAVAIVDTAEDQALLTKAYTDKLMGFIEEHHQEPFFAFVPHSAVHKPHLPLPSYLKKAQASPGVLALDDGPMKKATEAYVALMEEIDDGVGEVMALLKRLKIDSNTLVLFLSDNGGLGMSEIQPFRGGKGGPVYEGHMRTPLIARWPAVIPENTTSSQLGNTVDLLPTLARWSGGALSSDIIDGRDLNELFTNPLQANSPHAFMPYKDTGWRRGPWKYMKFQKGKAGKRKSFEELYHLSNDPGERTNFVKKHRKKYEELQMEHGKWLKKLQSEQRPHALMSNVRPLVSESDAQKLPRLKAWMDR
jgi:arylsulfatase A-like enzyme